MSKFNVKVKLDTPLTEAITLMCGNEKNKFIAGFVVVVDDDDKVLGALSDGDIRRGISRGVGLNSEVGAVANMSPVRVRQGISRPQMRKEIINAARKRGKNFHQLDKVILVDEKNQFQDVIFLADILDNGVEDKIISVYGLGFVGLTLAATMGNSGLLVVGVDSNLEVVNQLKQGKPHFFENGLESLLLSLGENNPIHFTTDYSTLEADIHIISVGTPVNATQQPDFSQITAVCENLSKILKKEDLVILRSTLPLGTTRKILIPILEKSGLKAGEGFYLAFAPERTVEGNALEELRTLPQIIGGINSESTEYAAHLFKKITHTVIEVESLEAAEMVKLINNTFRDLTFSFANEVSYMCDEHNLNAFRLIEAANEGYPRNPIPTPSPGVGGACLSKDPYLYANPISSSSFKPGLGIQSRQINSKGPEKVLAKLEKFCTQTNRSLESLQVLLVGLAFKGMPETSDIRDSASLEFLKLLPSGVRVLIKDFVVSPEAIEALGCTPVDQILDGFNQTDVVLVLNNHFFNNKFNINDALKRMNKPGLFYDGWNLFNQVEIEAYPGIYYATLGYLTDH